MVWVGLKGAAAAKERRNTIIAAKTFLEHFPNADIILVFLNHSTEDGHVLYGVDSRNDADVGSSVLKAFSSFY
jgi:hypothetical protein